MYIHIGAGKTGTSAIQSFMNYNRKKLFDDFYCLYPNFQSHSFSRGLQHNHCPLFTKYEKSVSMKCIQNMLSYSNKNHINKIVISCEGLLNNSNNEINLLKKISDTDGVNCMIIVYLRRQDHWIESAWKQWGVRNNKIEDIYEYVLKSPINWLENLSHWADGFGKDNIIVRPYEKEQLSCGLICDFLNILDIQYQGYQWTDPPKNNINENIGFNTDIIEILRLNREFYKTIHDNRLLHFFSEYLDDNYRKSPFEKYSLLSPEQRIEILNKYEPMNINIAKEYLGRENGKLFYEPWPDPNEPWEPYEGLTVEKVVPIFTNILYRMDVKYRTQLQNIDRNTQKKRVVRKKIGLSLKTTKRWIKKLADNGI